MKVIKRVFLVLMLLVSITLASCKKEEHVHNYEQQTVVTEATCGVEGVKELKCSCGDVKQETIPALEHSYIELDVKVKPTCTTNGIKEVMCENCGDIKEEEIQCEGHKAYEATCQSVSMCLTCGVALGTELGDHSYQEVVLKEATCTINGILQTTCLICGESKATSIPALGHSYSEWNVLLEATCTENGLQNKECSTCHHVVEEEIKSGHKYDEWILLQKATCVQTGLQEHYCLVCEFVEREELEKVDHVFGEWEVAIEASCIADGTEHRKCVNCDTLESKLIEKIPHEYGAENILLEATCTTHGSIQKECGICNHIDIQPTELVSHKFETVNDKLVCSVCHLEENILTELVNKVKLIELKADSENGLVLPEEIEGYPLTWKSYSPSVVLDDGTVYASKKVQQAVVVATLNYEGSNVEVKFDVEIPVLDTSTIDYCWRAYYSLKIPSSTATDIRFLTKDYGGVCSVVKYESSNENVISHNGEVHQAIYDQEATITCMLQVGKVIQSYSVKVVLRGYTELQRLEKVIDWIPSQLEELKNGNTSILPITHETYGTTISWFCMKEGVIAGEGVFVKPSTIQDLTLYCTVICGEYNRELEFEVTNIGGNITKLEQLEQWMKGQIPSRIMGTRNFVLANDSFDYQIRTNSGGALNLIDGQYPEVDRSLLIDTTKTTWVYRKWGSGVLGTDIKPELTQAILDKMMYTGYQKPNEENILWVTVHESGMPREKNDALLLAQVQWDTAIGLRSRSASWHYQVDENKIYQSFEDNIICWHASDGSATPGNGNTSSIGIEMCINSDGNYEGAMRMDAKLIAMLMHKYNLKLENIKRHFDFAPDKKQCPYYMIETGRWLEFLNLVDKEYMAMEFLKDAKVTWTVTTDTCDDTETVLKKYFKKGGSTLYYSLPVEVETVLHITMTVEYEGTVLTHSNDLTLYPTA